MLKLCKKYLRVPQAIVDTVQAEGLQGLSEQDIFRHRDILLTPFVLSAGKGGNGDGDAKMIFDSPYFLLGDYAETFKLTAQLFVLDRGHPFFFEMDTPIVKAVVIFWDGDSALQRDECSEILKSIKSCKQNEKWNLLRSCFKKADGAECIFKSPSDLVISVWENADHGSAYRNSLDYGGYNLLNADIDFLLYMKTFYLPEFVAFCNVLMDFVWVADVLVAEKFILLSRKFFSSLVGKDQFWNIIPYITCKLDISLANNRIAYVNGIIRKLMYPISFYVKSLKSAGVPPLVLDSTNMNPLQIEIASELSKFAVVDNILYVNVERFRGLYEEKLLRAFVLDHEYNRRRQGLDHTSKKKMKTNSILSNRTASEATLWEIAPLRLDSDPLETITDISDPLATTTQTPLEQTPSSSKYTRLASIIQKPRKRKLSTSTEKENSYVDHVATKAASAHLDHIDGILSANFPVGNGVDTAAIDLTSLNHDSFPSSVLHHEEIVMEESPEAGSIGLADLAESPDEGALSASEYFESVEIVEIVDINLISTDLPYITHSDIEEVHRKDDDDASIDFWKDLDDDHIDVERLDDLTPSDILKASQVEFNVDPNHVSIQVPGNAPPTPQETFKDGPSVERNLDITSYKVSDLLLELIINENSNSLILLNVTDCNSPENILEDIFVHSPSAVVLSSNHINQPRFTTSFEANGGFLEVSTSRSDIILEKWHMLKTLKGRSIFRYIELLTVVFDVTDIYFCGSFVNQTLLNRISSRFPSSEYPNLKFFVCENY